MVQDNFNMMSMSEMQKNKLEKLNQDQVIVLNKELKMNGEKINSGHEASAGKKKKKYNTAVQSQSSMSK